MASTMQQALLEAGLVNGTKARQATRKKQTMAPSPTARAATLPGLPAWLIKERIQLGTVADLVEALGGHRKVYLVHSSGRSYTEVVEATPKNNPRTISLTLGGEDAPRVFSLRAEVRFILTNKGPK